MAELHCLMAVVTKTDEVGASQMHLYADDALRYSASPLFQFAASTFQPSSFYLSMKSFHDLPL